MKKLIILTFVLSFVFGFTAHSQSLELVSYDETVTGTPDEELNSFGQIKNISSVSAKVMMKVIKVDVVEGHEFSMCWGICVGVMEDNQLIDPNITLAPGETSASGWMGYHLTCSPYEIEGQSVVKVVFFVDGNTEDKVEYTITYNASLSSVNTIDYANSVNLFPNPANDILNVSSDKSLQNVEIIDFTGRVVMMMDNIDKNAVINVNHLPTGVYFIRSSDMDKVKRFVINR